MFGKLENSPANSRYRQRITSLCNFGLPKSQGKRSGRDGRASSYRCFVYLGVAPRPCEGVPSSKQGFVTAIATQFALE